MEMQKITNKATKKTQGIQQIHAKAEEDFCQRLTTIKHLKISWQETQSQVTKIITKGIQQLASITSNENLKRPDLKPLLVDTSMLSNSTAMFDNCSNDFYTAINDLNLQWQKEKQQYDLQIGR